MKHSFIGDKVVVGDVTFTPYGDVVVTWVVYVVAEDAFFVVVVVGINYPCRLCINMKRIQNDLKKIMILLKLKMIETLKINWKSISLPIASIKF